MTLIYLLQEAVQQAAPQAGEAMQQAQQAAGQQGQTGGGWTMWIMLALIFVVMWLFMIRPQRKQQKELENFRNSLKKGDKIVTVGGIYGEIVEVSDRTVLIKVDGDTKLRVDKAGLVRDMSDTQQK